MPAAHVFAELQQGENHGKSFSRLARHVMHLQVCPMRWIRSPESVQFNQSPQCTMLQSHQPDELTIVDVAMSPRGNCTMSQFTIGLAESHQHSSNDNVLSGPPAVTRQEIPEPLHWRSSSSRHSRSHRLGNTCGTCRNSTFAHIASQQEIIAACCGHNPSKTTSGSTTTSGNLQI